MAVLGGIYDHCVARIQVVDLFAGCGGLTAGLHSVGIFDSVQAVELDSHAATTYALNFPRSNVFQGRIEDWVGTSVPKADVVVGGPPCQGFSALGKQDPSDPRNKLWRHYVEVLETVRPAFFLIENVPQFLKSLEFADLVSATRRGQVLESYELQSDVLVATDFGAAQKRRRAVVIGRRRGTRALDLGGQRREPRVLRDVIPQWMDAPIDQDHVTLVSSIDGANSLGPFTLRDLHVTRNVSKVSGARYRAIPPGGNRMNLPPDLQAPCWKKHRSGAGDVMGRLSWHKPSVTIRTEFFKPEKGRYLHPEQHRPITHAEAAQIQGFPENFLWFGTKSSIARQIGNAVPIPLGAAIGRALADILS